MHVFGGVVRNECTPYGGLGGHGRRVRRVRVYCAPLVGVLGHAVRVGVVEVRNECTPYGGGHSQPPIQTKTPTKMNNRISTTVATMPPMRASDMGFLGGFSGGRGVVMGVRSLGLVL